MRNFSPALILGWLSIWMSAAIICPGQNLVQNPGFEPYILCPNNQSQIHWSPPWQRANGSPDLYNMCAGSIYTAMPVNYVGSELPFAGNGVGGGLMWGSFSMNYLTNFREFLFGQLTSNLVPGTTYYISFHASLADNSSHAVNNLGLNFTNTYTYPTPITNSSHVFTPNIVNQTSGYYQVSGSFTPSIAYSYFQIGNFFADTLSMVQNMAPVTIGHMAYYYIDEVCVSTNPADCGIVLLPVEWGAIKAAPLDDNAIRVEWETMAETGEGQFHIQHSLDGTSFTTIGELPMAKKGGKNAHYGFTDRNAVAGRRNYYRLRLIDQDGSMHTSAVVHAMPEGIAYTDLRVSPNPIRQGEALRVQIEIEIEIEIEGRTAHLEIWDISGRLVFQEALVPQSSKEAVSIPTERLQPGYYRVVLRGERVIQSTGISIN